VIGGSKAQSFAASRESPEMATAAKKPALDSFEPIEAQVAESFKLAL
jgi:hypothetical protein